MECISIDESGHHVLLKVEHIERLFDDFIWAVRAIALLCLDMYGATLNMYWAGFHAWGVGVIVTRVLDEERR